MGYSLVLWGDRKWLNKAVFGILSERGNLKNFVQSVGFSVFVLWNFCQGIIVKVLLL